MSEPGERLFVYGTLRRGAGAAHQRFLSSARYLCMGKVRGRLYDLGDYPAFVESAADEFVIGEVYALPEAELPALDRYEGCGPEDKAPTEYSREIVQVRTEPDGSMSAWTYVYRWPTDQATLIVSGDYLSDRR